VSRRFIREEGGFTLPEMLVSITLMIVMLFALYSVFDMSIRVFGFGNDKLEAT
jgi:prepilin-type N-terminal cleavage/methylation domain-containing protein